MSFSWHFSSIYQACVIRIVNAATSRFVGYSSNSLESVYGEIFVLIHKYVKFSIIYFKDKLFTQRVVQIFSFTGLYMYVHFSFYTDKLGWCILYLYLLLPAKH